jgi:hypothetical protein
MLNPNKKNLNYMLFNKWKVIFLKITITATFLIIESN